VHHLLCAAAATHVHAHTSNEAATSADEAVATLLHSCDQDDDCALATPVSILAALTPLVRRRLYMFTTTLSVLPKPVVDASLAALEHIQPIESASAIHNGAVPSPRSRDDDGDDDEDGWLLRALAALCSSTAQCLDTAAAHVIQCCELESKKQTNKNQSITSSVASACEVLCKAARAIQAAAVDGESLLAAIVLEHQNSSENSTLSAVPLAQSWRWLQFSATLLLGMSDAVKVASSSSWSESGYAALAAAMKAVCDEGLSRAVKLAAAKGASYSTEHNAPTSFEKRTHSSSRSFASLTLAPATVSAISEAAFTLHVAGQARCGRGLAGALLREMLATRRRPSSSTSQPSSEIGNDQDEPEPGNHAIPDFVLDDALWDELAMFVDGDGSSCSVHGGNQGRGKEGSLAALSGTLFQGDLSMRRAVLYALASAPVRHHISAPNDDTGDDASDPSLKAVERRFQITRGNKEEGGLGAQLLAQQLEDRVPLRRNFAKHIMVDRVLQKDEHKSIGGGSGIDTTSRSDDKDDGNSIQDEQQEEYGKSGTFFTQSQNQLTLPQVSLLLKAAQVQSSIDRAHHDLPDGTGAAAGAGAARGNVKVIYAIVAARTSIDRLAKTATAAVTRMHVENTRRCDDATSEADRLAEIAKNMRADANITNKTPDHRKLVASNKASSKNLRAAATEAEAAAAVAAVVASSVEASSFESGTVPEFVVQTSRALLSLLSPESQTKESTSSSLLASATAISLSRAFSMFLFRTIVSLGGPEGLGNVLTVCRDHQWTIKALSSVLSTSTPSTVPSPLLPSDNISAVRERLRTYASESAKSGPATTIDCTSIALSNPEAWHAVQSVQNALDLFHGTLAAIAHKKDENQEASAAAASSTWAVPHSDIAAAKEVIKVLERVLAFAAESNSSGSAEASELHVSSAGTMAAVVAVASIFDSLFPVTSSSKVAQSNRSFLRGVASHFSSVDTEGEEYLLEQGKGTKTHSQEAVKQRLSAKALSVATAFCNKGGSSNRGNSTASGSGCVPALLHFATQAKATHNDISYAFALARTSGNSSTSSSPKSISAVEIAPRCLKLALHLGLVQEL